MSNWLYNNEVFESENIENNLAFVYLITNLIDGRMYVGKKLFFTHKYRVKNKKRRKIKVESDWKNYWSSSPVLKEQIEFIGMDNFKREIIHLCLSKGTANYLEAREQMDRRVLESDMYYNGIINCRVNEKHIKL